MACYAYEELAESIMTDFEFDMLGRYIYDNYDKLEHRHKYLIDRENCHSTSALTIPYDDLPTIIKEATYYVIEEQEKENESKRSNKTTRKG